MIINSGCMYFALDGTAVDLSEDVRWSDISHGKYNNGMANYLDRAGESDEWTGDVESPIGCVQRFGKRILLTDERGFVTVLKYENEAKAISAFERDDESYGAWLDSENEGAAEDWL